MKGNKIKTFTERRIQMEGILNMIETTKKKMIVCSMAMLIICLWATASFASWSIGLYENGQMPDGTYVAGGIAKIEIFNLGGTSGLEGPGVSFAAPGSWTAQMPNANYVVATNAGGISAFNWTIWLTGTSSDSLHLAYLAYASNGQVAFGQQLDYNGSWSFPVIQALNPNDPIYNRTNSSVPLPPAVFLFSGGLFSLVAFRKKIKM
jgi:hypothetical protein